MSHHCPHGGWFPCILKESKEQHHANLPVQGLESIKGTVATDARARKFDEQCRHQKESVFAELKQQYPKLTLQKKLTKVQIPGGKGACEPDGGAVLQWCSDCNV